MLPAEKVDPQQAGPSLHLDALEEADGEQRGIYGQAIHAGGDVRQTVEVILGRARATRLVVDRLGATDEAAAPEEDARNLAEQITDRGGVAPLDGVAGEDDPGERRPWTGGLE